MRLLNSNNNNMMMIMMRKKMLMAVIIDVLMSKLSMSKFKVLLFSKIKSQKWCALKVEPRKEKFLPILASMSLVRLDAPKT